VYIGEICTTKLYDKQLTKCHTKNLYYDTTDALENWQARCQFNLAHKLKQKTKNVLNGIEKSKKSKIKK